jgi:hypothetical protein
MLPFQMPSSDVFFASPKKVFAHYFYPFPLSEDNAPAASDYYNTQYLTVQGEGGIHSAYGGYLRTRPLGVTPSPNYVAANMQAEVRMAIARGITGFTFDILNMLDAESPTGHLDTLLNAAQAVDPRFDIVPMLDMSAMPGITQPQATALIASFTHPSIARLPDGRLLIAAFNAGIEPMAWWNSVFAADNAQNVNVAFIPVLLGNPGTSGQLSAVSLGLGGWGTATPSAATGVADYMNPVLPQQFRPKSSNFWEAGNCHMVRFQRDRPGSALYGFEPKPKHWNLGLRPRSLLRDMVRNRTAAVDRQGRPVRRVPQDEIDRSPPKQRRVHASEFHGDLKHRMPGLPHRSWHDFDQWGSYRVPCRHHVCIGSYGAWSA